MIRPILITLGISFIVQILFFILAASLKTDKVTDLAYGLSFVILALYSLFTSQNFFLTQIILTAMVVIWGLRLAGYLFIRILKMKKDDRFDGIRENFFKFLGFWTFQALTVWIIMLPTTYVLNLNQEISLSTLSYIGIFIWLFGFLIETIADQQKFTFKNKNKNKLIKSGLWKYSRHPNYFGEMVLWWGLFVMTIPYQDGLSWITIIGPIFITFILLFVSGIPMLEKKHAEKYGKEYEEYKEKTSVLIPWFTK